MRTSFTTSATEGRIGRRRLLPVLVLAAILLTSATDLRGASIGVNFAPTAILSSGTSAGVSPQTNWQNITSLPITGVGLTDNTGSATGAALTVTASSFFGFGSYNPSATPGDEQLMGTNLASNGTMTLTITAIPYAAYDLIIYNLPLFSGVKYTYTVGSTSYFGNSPSASNTSAGYVDGNSGTPFNYLQATSTNTLSPTANATYARFDGLTSNSLTFTVTGANGIGYTNGFQILEVPEPSRAVLLLGGILAVSFRRRR